VSRNELIIFTELHQFFKKVISTKKIGRKSIDVFIEDFNLAIEYDGCNWHKDLKRDKLKNKELKEKEILPLRIREYPLKKIEKQDIIYNVEDNLFEAIEYILNFIMDNYKIKKIMRNKIDLYLKNKKVTNQVFFESIRDQYKIKKITHSILFEDFDSEKNSLPLHYYGKNSTYQAFWKCNKCNLEYKKAISLRSRCPNCHNCRKIELNKKGKNKKERKRYREKLYYNRKNKNLNKVLTSKRDFDHALPITKTHPKILVELPIDRLEELKKLGHTNSRIYFNTKCYNCKHEFKTNMWNKTKEKQPCPNCNFNILLPETDLLKNHHNLMTEYHNDNSIDLRYTKLEYPKLLNWICAEGHITKKTIKNKVAHGDCHECNKGKLVTEVKKVIDTWDYSKNDKLNLDPSKLTSGSRTKAHFKCPVASDHEWFVPISKRTKHNCPYCANQQISSSNMLVTTHPEIAALWSTNNKETKPDIYIVSNGKTKFIWKCAYCHEEFSKEIVQMKRTDGMCSCCKTYNLGDNKGKKKGNS
jgi:very-short-patch-repair endonuclease